MDDELSQGVDELLRLTEDEPEQSICEQLGISAESLSCHDGNQHGKQLAMISDAALYEIVLCSRRAGKTYGLACLALLKALSKPRQNIIYIGLSKPHARKFLWEEVWKPLMKAWKVPCKMLEDEMTTKFPNGSIMYVSGTDDVRHIESFLGNRLDLAIVDEAQSQSDSVLIPLTTRILPNALLDDMENPGKLVLSGTIPEVDAGHFMEVWKGDQWSKHNWNRFENPYLKDQPAALKAFLSANPGLTEESPEVQREWFGRFVFDKNATAYTYDPEINGYVPTAPDWLALVPETMGEALLKATACLMAAVPLPGIEYFSCALDVGGADRVSVQVNGWGRMTETVQHVFDWTSMRKAALSWDQMGQMLGVVAKHFSVAYWWYDSTSTNELDTFTRLYGVPVVKAANKSDMPGQVRLTNNLLTSGKYKVMRRSALEEDYQKTRWDQDARSKQIWKWARAWHPDPADASRYSLRPYFDAFQKPVEPPKDDLERHRAEVRAMLKEAKMQDERGRDDLAAIYGE